MNTNKNLNYFFILFGVLFTTLIEAESPSVFTLDEAIKYALNNNKSILASKEGVKSAEAGKMIAGGSFLPQINASGSYTRLDKTASLDMAFPKYGTLQMPVYDNSDNVIGYTIVPGVIGADTFNIQMSQLNNYVTQLSVQQPIFTWGKIINAYQISNLNLNATRESYRKDKNELILNVTKSFYGILVLQELVKVTEESYKQVERHIGVIEKRYNSGLASKFDLLRGKVQLANMKPHVLKVTNGLEIAKDGFKLLLGLPQDKTIELTGELKYDSAGIDQTFSLEEATTFAHSNRPEIKSLYMQKEMAKKALTITRTSNLPNIVFVGNYYYEKPLNLTNEWGNTWNVTLAATMPIFTGFSNLGKMKQAKSQLSQAEYGLKLLKEAVEMEVKSGHMALEEAKKLLESQKENVTQAEEALKIIEQKYENGLATNLEVMDTQLALTQAKTNWLQALSDYLTAKASLAKAIGK